MRTRARHIPAAMSAVLSCAIVGLGLVGCESAPRNLQAVRAYYEYEFTDAREALRGDAYTQNDEQVLLNNLRLGMAALADGDADEAERALGTAFDLLSTAGLNRDRTTAAVWVHEGVRIWKGEPFEQALAYYYVAALYAAMGDWENMRAAAANALFRLTDFGGDQEPEDLVRKAAQDENYLDRGYTAVDTNFALGFLMQAVGADLSGSAGSDEQFAAAIEIDSSLEPLVETLRNREYDTLLIVDYGKGPTKIAYGPDDALVRFDPQERGHGPLVVTADGETLARAYPVCDVDAMAQDLRWNNLEDVRKAKSAIGELLVTGGAITTAVGINDDSAETALIGAGVMLAGLLTKSGAKADTRYLEFAPKSVFLVPLFLGEPVNLALSVEGSGGTRMALPQLEPGKPGSPAAYYFRLHGPDSPQPSWLTATELRYGNDHVDPERGGAPWILGGHDVSTPNREALDAYRATPGLESLTMADLLQLYEAEGIVIGSGMEARPDVPKNPSYRHVLEGGSGLFTPLEHSMGYKRLMFTEHGRYDRTSEFARNLAERLRVHTDE